MLNSFYGKSFPGTSDNTWKFNQENADECYFVSNRIYVLQYAPLHSVCFSTMIFCNYMN